LQEVFGANEMKVYCGSTAGKTLKYLWDNNYGLTLTPKSWRYQNNAKWRYWTLDNGAYSSYVNNENFDEQAFTEMIYKKLPKTKTKPDFIIVPDIVGGGLKSLEFSLTWIDKLKDLDYNWYLAVQDGMKCKDIEPILDKFDGIFVGGTIKWKVRTGEEWVRLAHDHKLRCHIGRVGVFSRIVWAKRIGADSIDSTNFLRNPKTGFRPLESAKAQTLLEA
tara:strand:+ start:14 stop:670 length:657 start_codon:yes stop_codon:yes gene_type:complete